MKSTLFKSKNCLMRQNLPTELRSENPFASLSDEGYFELVRFDFATFDDLGLLRLTSPERPI